jgi:hypothetical protein
MKLLNIIIVFLSLIGMIHATNKNQCGPGGESCTNAKDCEEGIYGSCDHGCCSYNNAD